MTDPGRHEGLVAALQPGGWEDDRRARLAAEARQLRGERDRLRARLREIDERLAGLRREEEQAEQGSGDLEADPARLRQAVRQGLAFDLGIVEARSRLLAQAPGGALDADEHPIAVLAALEPTEGPAVALELVLPVPAEVHRHWRERGDQLGPCLAWRVMAALAVALRDSGAADAPIRYESLSGCLSFQVWLGDSDMHGDVKELLSTGFDRIYEQGRELRAARLELFLAWVDPEVLMEDEKEGRKKGSTRT